MGRDYDLSVVLPFGDDEDVVGVACRRVAAHLRAFHLRFEILAVDEDSGDNSHAVLALVRLDVPELRVIGAVGRDRGLAVGVSQARGSAVWLLDVAAALAPLAPFARAHRHVARGQADVVVVENRFAVCYRTRCLDALDGVRGHGDLFHRRVLRRARARRLACEIVPGGGAPELTVEPRTWTRLLDAVSAARSAWISAPPISPAHQPRPRA
jgi:hypothetical protein